MSTIMKDESNEQMYVMNTFQNGINEYLDKTVLDNTCATKIQNAKVENGVLAICKGSSKFSTAKLTTAIKSIFTYYKDHVGYIIVASGDSLYKLNTVTNVFDLISNGFTSDIFDAVNFNTTKDIIIISNGVDNMKLYDGTTIRNVLNRRPEYNDDGTIKDYVDGNGTVHATEADITTYAPKSKFVELHYERIWGADDDNLYFSSANQHAYDPDDWTYPIAEGEANQHGGVISVPTFDGGKIIGLKVVFNSIVLFKEKQVIRIFGTYPGNYTKDQLFSTTGGIADKSIVAARNGVYFIAYDGIYLYDGTNVTKISDKIKDTWEMLNQDYLKYAVAAFYDNKYILAVSECSYDKDGIELCPMENNLIIEYNTVNGSFTFRRGVIVNCFAEYDNKLIYVNDSGYIYLYDNSSKYEESINVDMFLETGITDMGSPNAVKTIEYCYFIGSGSGDVKFSFYSDKFPTTPKTKTITLTSDTKEYKFKMNLSGRLFWFRIENVSGSDVKISPPKITYDLDFD